MLKHKEPSEGSLMTLCSNLSMNFTISELQTLDTSAIHHAIAFADGHIVVREWGSGSPVVLLHGGSGSWKHWVKNISALVDSGRKVLVPDMPGFGESAAPLIGQDADVIPEPLEHAIDQVIPNQQYELVAFSFGSMVAAQMVVRNPERISKLVLSGSPALGINELRPFKLKPWNDLPEGTARDAIHRHNLGVLMLSNIDAVDDLALIIHRSNLNADRMKRRRLAYTDFLLQLLEQIHCPVFGIWGALDVLYRDNHAAVQKALEQAPNFQTLKFINGAGHWAQFERPAEFNAALLDALS
jgi:2-hydroxy-6-oxonona-2,4-dienedioate hydrolase